jgi:putative spermidine/putrescine transport system permease protein
MWRRSKPYLFVLPALGAIGILFYGGLFQGLVQSLGFFPAAGQTNFSIYAYRKLLSSPDFWTSLLLTLRISFLSTLAASILGLFVAVCLFMLGKTGDLKRTRFWQRFFQLPLVVPHLVGAYLMVLLLMQSGWLSRLLFAVGWIDEIGDFPVLVNEPFGIGIILAYAWKEAPFIALMVYPVLLRIHGAWLEVAQVFGADRWNFFREILLPIVMPAWLSSAFIVFAFTFSSFEVPFLLGVTYPKMLPVLSYDFYTSGGLSLRPEALAVNVILALITALLGIAAYLMSRRWSIGEGKGW